MDARRHYNEAKVEARRVVRRAKQLPWDQQVLVQAVASSSSAICRVWGTKATSRRVQIAAVLTLTAPTVKMLELFVKVSRQLCECVCLSFSLV